MPRLNKINLIPGVVGSIIFSLLFFAAFHGRAISILIAGSLFLLLNYSLRAGFIFGIFGSLIFEIISPFPPYVILLAWSIAFLSAYFLLSSYITHRGMLGAILSSLIGTAVFELALLTSAQLTSRSNDGFLPVFNSSYLGFVLERIIISTLLLTILFALRRRLSPQVRGVMLS